MQGLEDVIQELKAIHLMPKIETIEPTPKEVELENSKEQFQSWLNDAAVKHFQANTLPSTSMK